MIERENKVLKEAHDRAISSNDSMKRQSEVLHNESLRLQTEMVQLQGQHSQDVSTVRGDLKLKNFELTAMSNMFEERMSLYRQIEAELEATKAELAAHRYVNM